MHDRRPSFRTPLLLAGARCVLRYILLPFVLPLLGTATGVVTGAVLVVLAVDVVAVVSIVLTLRRLWRQRHPRRWRYLPLALALLGVVAFFVATEVRAFAI